SAPTDIYPLSLHDALPICHLAVVWVGYDSDEPTGFTGSAGALPVWAHIMAGLNTSSWEAPMPEGLAEMHIEFPTGLRVAPGCSRSEEHTSELQSLAYLVCR